MSSNYVMCLAFKRWRLVSTSWALHVREALEGDRDGRYFSVVHELSQVLPRVGSS